MLTTMLTRQDYLAGKCTHSEYYAQFVTAGTRSRASQIGIAQLKASTDPHLNDISLAQWDRLAAHVPYNRELFKQANDNLTLAGQVCLLKEAARQLIAEN